MPLLTELDNLVKHISLQICRAYGADFPAFVSFREIRVAFFGIEIGSPRRAFVAKLCASCESSPWITEPNASALR
jgi:hypothetical protein